MPSLLLKLLTINKQTGNIFMFLLGFYLSYTPTYPSEATYSPLRTRRGARAPFRAWGLGCFTR